MTPREAARAVRRCFEDRDLLTFSSAIAFQVLFAIIPLVLFGALATVVVGLTYLYLAASAVLVGAQLDALVRERVRNGKPGATVAA